MAISLGHNKSYTRSRYVIPANSIYTVDFTYNSPNFYRLNNTSNVMLYCTTNSMPTDTLYDFKANPLSVANFTEPATRDKLYILNQSNNEAVIILTTWADEFDPTFMAVSEITLNGDGVMKTDGAVKSFETELPPGNNVIGKVGLDEEALNKLDSNKLYQWCVNKLLSESGHGLLENFNEYLYKIQQNTENSGGGSSSEVINLLTTHFNATGMVANLTGHDDMKSIFDLLYWIYENTAMTRDLTGNISEGENVIGLLSRLVSIVNNSNKNAIRIINGTANGYVMDETWVKCDEDTEYVGEILNMSDKIEITTIRAKVSGDTDLEGFTIEEWNNICHIIKAHTVSFVMKDNDQNNRIFPYFAVYLY